MVGNNYTPLSAHGAFQSTDLGQFRSYLSSTYCDHKIHQKASACGLNAIHNRVPLTSMSLNYLQYGADVEIDPESFDEFYMLELPQTGSVQLKYGEQDLLNVPGRAVILSPERRIKSRWSADCGQRMIKIAKGSVEKVATILLGRVLPQTVVFDPMLDLGAHPGQSIQRLSTFLFDQYEVEPGVVALKDVSRELEQALITALLLGQPNTASEALEARCSSATPRHVKKVVDYIEEHLGEDISLAELVLISSVSQRALYSGFERFIGMPPNAYIRNRRLEKARDDLLLADGSQTVAQIAMRWNFNHLGRFSTEYKKRFSESPSETLQR